MRSALKYIILFCICATIFGGQLIAQNSGTENPTQSDDKTEEHSGPRAATIGQRDQKSSVKLANPPLVSAKFEPDSVAIGDHFSLEVQVTQDVMQFIGFPEFEDGMLGGIVEILAESDIDTLKKDGRQITVGKKYTLTCFDEGWYGMGLYPMLYMDKNVIDTIWSADSLYLKVGTFEIDTATMSIYDIKRPMELPLKFGEISGYGLWGLLILVLIGALVWYLFTRKRNLTILGKPIPIIPPHVEAIKALESLHHQKLWQNNKHKLYYTGITEILREYIEKRYEINAMEMITPEIINALKDKELPDKSYADLIEILQTADLVKFAKLTPDADGNEMAYTDAYYFVEATKPLEIDIEDEDEESEEKVVTEPKEREQSNEQ